MTVRDSMADLITTVRTLIGDPVIAGTPPTSTFTDQQVQDALDQHRTLIRDAQLYRLQSIDTHGTVTWPTWFAPRGYWEGDVALKDESWTVLTPVESDLNTGVWTVDPPVQYVRIVGQCYDPYGAAVDLLLLMLPAVASQFDFSTDGQSFSRSQQMRGIQALIDAYRVKARPPAIRVVQVGGLWAGFPLNPQGWWPGEQW